MSLMFPLTGAAEDLWFTTSHYTTAVTSLLSCVRASNGFAKNADGTLTQFASNVLRIGTNGLLVEDARTNLTTQSQDIAHGTGLWIAENLNTTADQAAAPDGTTTMDKLDDGAGFGRHIIYINGVTITAGSNYVFSVFAKNIDRQYIQLSLGESSVGLIYCYADLQNGTITDSGVGFAGTGTTLTSATIEAFSGGVYRISLSGIVNTTTTTIYPGIALSDRSTQGGSLVSLTPSYTGTTKSVYAWGAQLELGAFVSSYIPTTGAAATRAADAVSCTGSLNTVLTALPQSAVVDIAYLSPVTTDARIIGQSSGATSLLYARSADTVISTYNGTAGELFITLGNSLTFSGGVKVGVAEAASARSIVGGGGTVNTDTASNTVMTSPYIGSLGGSAPYSYAYVRRLTVWNSKLADVTIQQLTDPNSAFYSEPTTLFAQACM